MYRSFYGPYIMAGAVGTTFAVIIGIVAYVLFALGLMKLAQNKGIENAWLAWIPIANFYLLGRIVETVNIGTWEIPRLEIVLPISVAAVMLLGGVRVLGFLLLIAFAVLMGFVLHRLFSKYRPDQAVLYTVLSIVLGLVWVFIFIIRNDKEIA